MLEDQRKFFLKNKSGCAFAAAAAKDMPKYGWHQFKCSIDETEIDKVILRSIAEPSISTISLIFEEIRSENDLKQLIEVLKKSDVIFLEKQTDLDAKYGFRFRAKVGKLVSWVTGFGPFDFLPSTRRAPFVELTIRVKPRPDYAWNFKPTPEGVIHLADMDMRGMADRKLTKLWFVSFNRTKKILGHEPDDESAAKTTFVVPKSVID